MIEFFQRPKFKPFSLEHHDNDADAGAILIHGFLGTPDEMRPLAESIYEQGLNCHALGLAGMGSDIGRLPEMTANSWRDAVLEEWRTLSARYRRTVIVGYSMGGAAAMHMAADHPPDLLILLAPFTRLNDWRAAVLPVASHVIPDVQLLAHLDLNDPDVQQWFRLAMPDVDLGDPESVRIIREETGISASVIEELRRFGIKARRQAPKIHAPVVVIQGHHDTVVTPTSTRALIDNLRLLRAYHEIPGDHLLPMVGSAAWPDVEKLVLFEIARQQSIW